MEHRLLEIRWQVGLDRAAVCRRPRLGLVEHLLPAIRMPLHLRLPVVPRPLRLHLLVASMRQWGHQDRVRRRPV
ncbi:hypothetical protein SBE55_04465 [Mycolicibacterium sp. 141076]|uniref:hypothetical protein n=1 Tax=Mycobacteriaceae TaxID=1762 RepID=UPI00299CDE0F|nr:hypothetical protein [Mycolicibacterium sp. 141076]MDX1877064.1 hypothetical protein [Mycolicibacterium sp. 141076]